MITQKFPPKFFSWPQTMINLRSSPLEASRGRRTKLPLWYDDLTSTTDLTRCLQNKWNFSHSECSKLPLVLRYYLSNERFRVSYVAVTKQPRSTPTPCPHSSRSPAAVSRYCLKFFPSNHLVIIVTWEGEGNIHSVRNFWAAAWGWREWEDEKERLCVRHCVTGKWAFVSGNAQKCGEAAKNAVLIS